MRMLLNRFCPCPTEKNSHQKAPITRCPNVTDFKLSQGSFFNLTPMYSSSARERPTGTNTAEYT